MSLREEAENYEGKNFKNISEMESISVDVDVQESSFQNKDDETIEYKYIMDGDEEVRVPASVLRQLKQHLEANPKLKTFRVAKEGEGLNTSYTVIPLK